MNKGVRREWRSAKWVPYPFCFLAARQSTDRAVCTLCYPGLSLNINSLPRPGRGGLCRSAACLLRFVLPPPCQGSSFLGPPQGCVMSRLNILEEDDDRYASNFHPGILSPAHSAECILRSWAETSCRRCKHLVASLAQQRYVNTAVPKSWHEMLFHGV